jgi:hypothetical protein
MVTLARLFLGQELPDSEVDLMNSRTLLTLVKEPAVRSAISKQKSALVILEDSMYVKTFLHNKSSFTINPCTFLR